MPPKMSTSDVTNLDKQIEILLECKPLPEADVKALCEKVPLTIIIRKIRLN